MFAASEVLFCGFLWAVRFSVLFHATILIRATQLAPLYAAEGMEDSPLLDEVERTKDEKAPANMSFDATGLVDGSRAETPPEENSACGTTIQVIGRHR